MAGFLDALRNGDLMDARRLLRADPALAEYREPNGVSAVLIARYLGHADMAREIADVHPNVDVFDAAALGDQHRLEELLNADPTLVGAVNPEGYTPLALAANFGHVEAVRQLLDAGADPNTESATVEDMTPLHLALARGYREVATVLVARGAEVDEPNGADWTPLHYVAESGDLETAQMLVDAGARTGYPRKPDGKTALEVAEDKGFRDLARLLAESAE